MARIRLNRGNGTPAALAVGEPALDLTPADERLLVGDNAGIPIVLADRFRQRRTTIADTPPLNPGPGDFWWSSLDLTLYIWYQDPTSAQWVVASPNTLGSDGNFLTEAIANLLYLKLTGGTVGPLTVQGLLVAAGATVQGSVIANAVTLGNDAVAPLQALPLRQAQQIATAAAAPNVGRNLFHNGLFNIPQRGFGPWTSVGQYYGPDRWVYQIVNDTLNAYMFTLVDADHAQLGDQSGQFGLQIGFTGSSVTGSFTLFSQRLEAVKRLSNKQVTVSFYARATTGTPQIGIGYAQVFGSGGSPSADSLGHFDVMPALSATWQRYSVTGVFPSIAGKTFGTNAGTDYTQLEFWLSDQGTYAERSGGIGVQSGTVQLWGMQLEIGTQATPLEKLDPATDLARCQRFYVVGSVVVGAPRAAGDTIRAGNAFFPVTMRALPTLTSPSPWIIVSYAPSGFYFWIDTGDTGSGAQIDSYTASADL